MSSQNPEYHLPDSQKIESNIQKLEDLQDVLEKSLSWLQTRFQTLVRGYCESAIEDTTDDLARVILLYREYWKQVQYIKFALNYYKKALELCQSEGQDNPETKALIHRLVTQAEEWNQNRMALGARPNDVPRRWQTSYYFAPTATSWTDADWNLAVSKARELRRYDSDNPSLEYVIRDLFELEILSIDPDDLLQTGAEKSGLCPSCNVPLFTTDVLVRYEKRDKEDGQWAVCPSCEEIVQPRELSASELNIFESLKR